MKPRSQEDWSIVLDAIEWFQRQVREKSPEEVRAWISPAPASSREALLAGAAALTSEADECERSGLLDEAGPHLKHASTLRALAAAPVASDGWVPVGERLPVFSRWVEVTYDYTSCDGIRGVGHDRYRSKKHTSRGKDDWEEYGGHVTAWREKSRPYEPTAAKEAG